MRRSHRVLPLAATALLLGLAAAARAADRVTVRDESASFTLEKPRALDVDVPLGKVTLTAAAGGGVQARLALRCDADSPRCRERAGAVHLNPVRNGDRLALKLEGYGDEGAGIHYPEPQLEITVPATLASHVHVGVGELELRGSQADVSVEIGVGEARLEIPERAVHSVAIEVGVGDAHLSPPPADARKEGFLFLGNKVSWHEGAGASHVTVQVGVGQAAVQLVP